MNMRACNDRGLFTHWQMTFSFNFINLDRDITQIKKVFLSKENLSWSLELIITDFYSWGNSLPFVGGVGVHLQHSHPMYLLMVPYTYLAVRRVFRRLASLLCHMHSLSLGHNPPCTSLRRVCVGFGSGNAENPTADARRRCVFWETQEHAESTQRLLNSVQ